MTNISQAWEHDALQADLARSRIGCGEVVIEKLSVGDWGGGGQMDVWTARLSRSRPTPTCYEVKVSRQDFLADVRAEKYKRYEPWAARRFFACPSGMIRREEIPTGWGLTQRSDSGWRVLKAAPHHKVKDSIWPELFTAVILALHPGSWREPDRRRRVLAVLDRDPELWDSAGRMGVFGRHIKSIMEQNNDLEREVEHLRYMIDRERKHNNQGRL